MGMQVGEEDMLNLSGKDWKSIPRVARTVPFGYIINKDNPDLLDPVLFELEALEQAKKHLKNGHSLRTVASWLSSITGRSISHNGLNKRVDIERRRSYKASTLKKWATAYKTTLEKVKSIEEKLGKDTTSTEEALTVEFT